MEISVIKIGNSKGLRLSKDILTRYNIKDTVELVLEKRIYHFKTYSTASKRMGKSIQTNARSSGRPSFNG